MSTLIVRAKETLPLVAVADALQRIPRAVTTTGNLLLVDARGFHDPNYRKVCNPQTLFSLVLIQRTSNALAAFSMSLVTGRPRADTASHTRAGIAKRASIHVRGAVTLGGTPTSCTTYSSTKTSRPVCVLPLKATCCFPAQLAHLCPKIAQPLVAAPTSTFFTGPILPDANRATHTANDA